MEQFTTLEQRILLTIKDILTETECFTSYDLIKDSPKVLRGALASLVKKGVVSIDSSPCNIDGVLLYEVDYWDMDAINSIEEEQTA
tara:strand:- start:1855 stop:2112 length:258 start_codon:yes stop_codon:yes gene_type:complete